MIKGFGFYRNHGGGVNHKNLVLLDELIKF